MCEIETEQFFRSKVTEKKKDEMQQKVAQKP